MLLPHPRRPRTWLLGALCLALAGAACSPGATPSASDPRGSGAACATAPSVPDDLEGWSGQTAPEDLTPVLITNPIACGANRILFSFIDDELRPVSSPDRRASFRFFLLGRDAGTPFATVDGTFVWAIEDAVGIYVANVDFPEAGRYGV